MFLVNFDALAQASDIRIERRQVVYLCWEQDSNLGSLRHQIASRLNARSQTDWAIEIHIYIYIPTYLPTYLPTCLPACLPACLPTYIHTCIHAYIHTYIHTYMHPSNIAHSPTYILQEPCEWYVSCTWCNCFVIMFCCCSLDDVALLGTKPLDPPDAEPAPSVEPTTSLPVEASPPSVSVEATHSSLLVEATSPSVSVEATPPSLPVQSTRPGFPTEPTGSRFEPLPMNYVIPLDFVSPPLRSALREGRKLIPSASLL